MQLLVKGVGWYTYDFAILARSQERSQFLCTGPWPGLEGPSEVEDIVQELIKTRP